MNAKKILVVDDNQVVLKSMSFMLSAKGYRVLMPDSAEEIIAILGRERPDLIPLDLEFPPEPASFLVDGFQTLECARRFGTVKDIPVIVISGLEPEQYDPRAKASGNSSSSRKPVDERKLLESIQAELEGLPA